MITTDQICGWVESMGQTMPPPRWIPEKRVYEYEEVTPEIVAYLKLVRAATSLHSLQILAENGLIYDFGTVTRCIIECQEDALFLLEDNPETKASVERFVTHFKNTTIDNATTSTSPPVKRRKIQNAAARIFPSLLFGTFGAFGEVEKHMKMLTERIWKAWCHSVHSNYAEIMQMYGPRGPRAKFQLRGIPREDIRQDIWEQLQQTRIGLTLTLWAAAMKLGRGELADEIGRAMDAAAGDGA